MAHEGLPDELRARVLMPLGNHDVLVYPEVLQERLRIPWRARRRRHVVAAHRLRVPADVQRERAFSARQHIVRSSRAGSELVLGPCVSIDEHPVPRLEVLVDRPHASVVIPPVPLLSQRERLPYLVDQVP